MVVVLEFQLQRDGTYRLIKKTPESVEQFQLGKEYRVIQIQADVWKWTEIFCHTENSPIEGTVYSIHVLEKQPEPAPKPLPLWKRVLRRRR